MTYWEVRAPLPGDVPANALSLYLHYWQVGDRWCLGWGNTGGVLIFQQFEYDAMPDVTCWDDVPWELLNQDAWVRAQCTFIGAPHPTKDLPRGARPLPQGIDPKEASWRNKHNQTKREKYENPH